MTVNWLRFISIFIVIVCLTLFYFESDFFVISYFNFNENETPTICRKFSNFYNESQAIEKKRQWSKNLNNEVNHFLKLNDLSGWNKFNMIGPIGPVCKNGLEKFAEGDDEKRACGLISRANEEKE